MRAVSRAVVSSQFALHPRLAEVVARHRALPWRKPIARHTLEACEPWQERFAMATRLLVDAGCGTGEFARRLAEREPQALVVGVDQSAARLARAQALPLPENLVLLRAELADFWRLAAAHRWPIAHQYLLYPNPWPKARHLRRRWHAHPVLPTLLTLGGTLEVRSNWRVYLEEFALALGLAGGVVEVEDWRPAIGDSQFECRFLRAGLPLWRLRIGPTSGAGPRGMGDAAPQSSTV